MYMLLLLLFFSLGSTKRVCNKVFFTIYLLCYIMFSNTLKLYVPEIYKIIIIVFVF